MISLTLPDALDARTETALEVNADLLVGEQGEHASAPRAEGIENYVCEVAFPPAMRQLLLHVDRLLQTPPVAAV